MKVLTNESKSFNKTEDEKLLKRYELYPANWKEIQKGFVGKNAAMIKERFY